MIKRISIVLLLLIPVVAFAQFPNNPVKQKLGVQTTALGLISYSDTIPLHTPASWRNDAELHADTTNDLTWKWTGYSWRLLDEVRRVSPPPATVTAGGNTLDYRYATWWRDTDSTYFQFNWSGSCWQPITAYRGDTIPDDIAAVGSSAAACFTYSDWYNTANDSLYFYVDGTWMSAGTGSGGGGSVDSALYVTTTRLADSTAAVRADFPGVISKLDTVVFIRLNDSTFVAHNYAGGIIVRSDTISGTGGGGGLTGTLTENYIPVADANGNLEDGPIRAFGDNITLGTVDTTATINVQNSAKGVLKSVSTIPSGSSVNLFNFDVDLQSSAAFSIIRGDIVRSVTPSTNAKIINYKVDGDEYFTVDVNGGAKIGSRNPVATNNGFSSSSRLQINALSTNNDARFSTIAFSRNTSTGAGISSNINSSGYGDLRFFTAGSAHGLQNRPLVLSQNGNFGILESSGNSVDYSLSITHTNAAIRLNPHTTTPTGALGVQWVNSGGYYLDHDGNGFLRRVLMENAAPTNGDLLEWNATNTRWEAVAPTMLTDMNYTLNANRTATLDAITNYETFSATPAAASDYVLTLPAPGPTYEGKQVVIYSADTSGTYNLSVTAGTTEIRDQLATVTSLTLDNGETNILACMQTGAATYKWVLIGNR